MANTNPTSAAPDLSKLSAKEKLDLLRALQDDVSSIRAAETKEKQEYMRKIDEVAAEAISAILEHVGDKGLLSASIRFKEGEDTAWTVRTKSGQKYRSGKLDAEEGEEKASKKSKRQQRREQRQASGDKK